MTAASPFRVTKTIALVGLMGAGKSSIGRRLAQRLGLPFIDADSEIEAAADATIEEIFQRHGEAAFRDGEPRAVLEQLIAQRYPIYAQADITVDSVDGPPEATLERVMAVLAAQFGAASERQAVP